MNSVINEKYRLHIVWIFFSIIDNCKEVFVYFIVLSFLFRTFDSIAVLKDQIFIVLGCYFIFICILTFFQWYRYSYSLTKEGLSSIQGGIRVTKRIIPYERINSINIYTSTFQRVFNVSSVTIDPGNNNYESKLTIESISHKQAILLKKSLQDKLEPISEIKIKKENEDEVNNENPVLDKHIIHYKITSKDIFLLSLISLEGLMIIPLISFITNHISKITFIDNFINFIYEKLTSNYISLSISIILIISISILFGYIYSIFKYGHYKTSSNKKKIFIQKGIFENIDYEVDRPYISGIRFTSGITTRLFRRGKANLICASDSGDDQIKRLYTIFPILKITKLNSELKKIDLKYYLTENVNSLPLVSIFVKYFRAFLLASSVFLIYSLVEFPLLILILFLVITSIIPILSYYTSGYTLNKNDDIQLNTGSINKNISITKFKKIEDIKVSQSLVQRIFGLSTMTVSLKSSSYKKIKLKDLYYNEAINFLNLYKRAI